MSAPLANECTLSSGEHIRQTSAGKVNEGSAAVNKKVIAQSAMLFWMPKGRTRSQTKFFLYRWQFPI